MPTINLNTDHAEKFSRPERWVRKGYIARKPTALRRLELRRVRRVRGVEVRRLALPFADGLSPCALLLSTHSDAAKHELDPGYDFDDDWFADNQNEWLWDCTMLGLDSIADSERSGFRVTIGDAAR